MNGAWRVSLATAIHRTGLGLLRVFAELEAVLVLCGAIIPTTVPGGNKNAREEDSGDESEDDPPRSKYGSSGATRRTTKTKKDGDSGSELDM